VGRNRAVTASGFGGALSTPGLALLLALLPACGHATERERPTAPQPADGDGLAALNRAMRASPQTERYGSLTVVDPYRALEADTEATRQWIDRQTARSAEMLRPHRSAQDEARLAELLAIGSIGDAIVGGTHIFVTKREGSRERAALYLMTDGKLGQVPIVDPATVGERAAIDWLYPSPDGRFVAYGISSSGDERSLLRVLDVARGEPLSEHIAHTKWTTVAWLNDGRGFYYTRYPAAGEPGFDAEKPDAYYPRVFFHALGADPKADPLVWGSETHTDFPSVTVGDSDRYVVVENHVSWTATDVHVLDRGEVVAERIDAPTQAQPFRTVVEGVDHSFDARVHRGQLLLRTNLGAPRYRIVGMDPAGPLDRDSWRPIVPQGAGTIRAFEPVGDVLALHIVQDVQSHLALWTLGGERRDVVLPVVGSLWSLSARPAGGELSFVLSSYFAPPAIYTLDAGDPAATPQQRFEVAHDLQTDAYAVSRRTATSRDGTAINVSMVHRRDMPLDGNNRVLLSGYGGFNISLLPRFTRTALHFVEGGGVFAVANLRGGGEFGEAWHRDGMLTRKHHVFEDFEAALRMLGDGRISTPARIAIRGGSNGGLLVGAMLTRSPQLFGAAIASVGLYDMLRYVHFPPAQLWVSEYGDPADPAVAAYLHGYSPYHQVKDGGALPATLIETADKDTRVHWAHSTKFAARLQEAGGDGGPVLFHMRRSVGHGRGTGLTDQVEQVARQEAFLRMALGQ